MLQENICEFHKTFLVSGMWIEYVKHCEKLLHKSHWFDCELMVIITELGKAFLYFILFFCYIHLTEIDKKKIKRGEKMSEQYLGLNSDRM
jgi:hypothetical protein